MDAFLDLVAGVKRFEIISHLRDQLALLQGFGDARRSTTGSAAACALYEFGESAQVLNNAVNATVLFLDLRGFTQTSEGQISERDLTRELYTVFDAFVPHVRRFGGTVDKFLGDGIMVTYGTAARGPPRPPERAAHRRSSARRRCSALRREGKTYFKMGIAIHYGRVYLARFIADEAVRADHGHRPQRQPGRPPLSAAKKPMDEDEADGPAGLGGRRAASSRSPSTATARCSTRASPSAATPSCSSRRTCPWCTPRTAGCSLHGVLRRADRAPHRHPLRGRREVQGRALELPRVRGRLRGLMRAECCARPGGRPT